MITKINMENVASFNSMVTLETGKKVNLIYGLNGVGKSTLSNYLYNLNDPIYSKCSINGISDSEKILVYNQKFINDNFYETEVIQGIFTLSKENKNVKILIDNTKNEINKLLENRGRIDDTKKEKEESYRKELENYKTEVWKIKTEYSGKDSILDFCFDGLKGSKDTLFKHLIDVKIDDDESICSVEELIKEASILRGTLEKKESINEINSDLANIEVEPIFAKIIVGKKDSSVADFIDRLQNSSWIEEGLSYVHFDDEKAQCPFCQQKTITKEIFKQINDFFDESYKKDKNTLKELLKQYKSEIKRIRDEIVLIKNNNFIEPYASQFDLLLSDFSVVTMENINKIERKINDTQLVIKLKSTKVFEEKINGLIDLLNDKINEYNVKISDLHNTRIAVKEKFWKIMRNKYSSLLNLYFETKNKYQDTITDYDNNIKKIEADIKKNNLIISDNINKTKNIDQAVYNINQELINIGITDFSIEKCSDEKALYHLKRNEFQNNIFKTLSEGEKMIISFLYFVEMCKGEIQSDSTKTKKIIVIDDPISSLSHIYVFNIGRIIQNEFFKTTKYEQIFVLTHSLYFFYELTNLKNDEREKTQALFRIIKNNTGSSFVKMKYEEIQNDYQSYWYVIKDKHQPPALIANCMRNIIEYFFNFVEKKDFNNVFQMPELQKTQFLSFSRYMNRESHSKGQNIFDIKEFDYELFKKAFHIVFTITGYEDHYKKMMSS